MLHRSFLLDEAPHPHSCPLVERPVQSFHIGHPEVVAKTAQDRIKQCNHLLRVSRLLPPCQFSDTGLEPVERLGSGPKIPPMLQEPDKFNWFLLVMYNACLRGVQLQMHLPFDDASQCFQCLLCFFFTLAEYHHIIGIPHHLLSLSSHLPVNSIQVDVCQQRAYDSSLRCSRFGPLHDSLLHHTSFQEHPYQPQHTPV